MIKDFIAIVKTQGLARVNRYEVTIPGFPSPNTNGARDMTTLCDAVNLPGINMATVAHRFYGDAYDMPYERMFDPVQLSFYIDSQLAIKAGFDRWMSTIINPVSRAVNYYKSYVRDVSIRILNVDDSSYYGINLYEAYPKSMASIQLDAAGRDVMKLQITLQYRYWEPVSKAEEARPTPATPFDGIPTQDAPGTTTGQGFDSRTLMQLEYGINPDGSSS